MGTKEVTKKAADKAHEAIEHLEAEEDKDRLELSVRIEEFEKDTLAPARDKKDKLSREAKTQEELAVKALKARMAVVKKQNAAAEKVANAEIAEAEAKTAAKNAASEKALKKQETIKLNNLETTIEEADAKAKGAKILNEKAKENEAKKIKDTMSANDAIEGVKEEESKQQKKIAAQKDKLKQTEAFSQDLKAREDKLAMDKKGERKSKRNKLEIDGKAQRASELEEKKAEEAAKAKVREQSAKENSKKAATKLEVAKKTKIEKEKKKKKLLANKLTRTAEISAEIQNKLKELTEKTDETRLKGEANDQGMRDNEAASEKANKDVRRSQREKERVE